MGTAKREVSGRVVRYLTRPHSAANPLEQWFIVGIDDDQKAMDAVTRNKQATDEVVEIIGFITPEMASNWGLRDDEIRLILPGETVSSWEAAN